ncbi:hypothetical protein M8C21_014380 [Ambrosia artemisiifolia]|uniref:Uncharacterized protein n=1 Tax=Ambrosia artemisiifolia TaxID=4212 RepID=A0AAD5CU59_AMBAR|nr:hypothetical protein M8C21_014380 [Ambrosia artemisiifolia]
MIAPKATEKFPLNSKALKENKSRSTITIGELLSKTQRGVLSKKVGRPNTIKDRSKEQLHLVDEDDDGIFEVEADQDEEDEDIEEIIVANNDMNMDDSSEDSQNEDDVHRLEIEQIQRPELEKAIAMLFAS